PDTLLEENLRNFGDIGVRHTTQLAQVVGVELDRDGRLLLREILHLGEVTRKPAAVPIGDSPGGRADLYAQAVLMVAPGLRLDARQHLPQGLGFEHLALIKRFGPACQVERSRSESATCPFELRVEDELAVFERASLESEGAVRLGVPGDEAGDRATVGRA